MKDIKLKKFNDAYTKLIQEISNNKSIKNKRTIAEQVEECSPIDETTAIEKAKSRISSGEAVSYRVPLMIFGGIDAPECAYQCSCAVIVVGSTYADDTETKWNETDKKYDYGIPGHRQLADNFNSSSFIGYDEEKQCWYDLTDGISDDDKKKTLEWVESEMYQVDDKNPNGVIVDPNKITGAFFIDA